MLKFIIRTYNQTQKFKTINAHKLWKILKLKFYIKQVVCEFVVWADSV
jgi:hypothetical protein